MRYIIHMKEPYVSRIEIEAPVFLGCLGALVFCALISAKGLDPRPGLMASSLTDNEAAFFEGPDGKPIMTGGGNFFKKAKSEQRDHVRDFYRQPESRELVIDFFTGLCPSREIAEAILVSADWFNIPPALAFALAWEESQLNPLAVNCKNRDGSIDRGLFQLNSRTFPNLEIQAFFSSYSNSWHGMNHLRYCIDTGRSEIAALAIYNAGTGRVTSSGTPKSTLDYISRILENRNKIENSFSELKSWYQMQQIELETLGEIAEEKPERQLLMPLKPLRMGNRE
jgi:hypothetical protein